MADAATLSVRLPGIDRDFKVDEWVHGRIFSRTERATGQSAAINAFSYIVGQAIPSGGPAATDRDTNMQKAGELAAGWQALIFSHQVEIEGDIDGGAVAVQPAINDARELVSKELVLFKVGRNTVYETSISKVAAGGGLWTQNTSNAFSQVNNGTPDSRSQNAFLIPVHLREGKNFTVQHQFPRGLSLSAITWTMDWLEGLIQRTFDAT